MGSGGPLRRPGWELVALSFAVLAQELALIRWLPGQVRVLAYFPNLILISAFLGLGLGALRAGRQPLRWTWPVSLLALTAAALGLSRIAFTQESASEHLWLLYYDLPAEAPVVEGVELPIVAVFLLSALTFLAPGQLVAERIRRFQDHSLALWGYVWDLTGSLLGVLAFAWVSFSRSPPTVWFALALVAALPLFAGRRAWVYVGLAAGSLIVVHGASRSDIYSPYYALSTTPFEVPGGIAPGGKEPVGIRANGSLHQVAAPLQRADPAPPSVQRLRWDYHLPYRLLGRPPGRVLVLGAGTGNDVSVALDEAAESVTAVEIDPVIRELGVAVHPDRPYDSPRVRALVTDARSFLNDTEESFDLIVFGTLDSMTRLSALSNVRLDNFVYTRESLQQARSRLAPGGGVALYFRVERAYIHLHLIGLLTEAFGEVPRIYAMPEPAHLFSHVYLIGPAFSHLDQPAPTGGEDELSRLIDVPDDDWPFLYLDGRGITPFYLTLMAIFSLLAVAGVALASPDMRRGLRRWREADVEMFLFGLAFLLMETRFVTEMSLVWGATWLTSAVVFGSILATVLLATVATQVRPIPWSLAAFGLVASLAVTYLLPTGLLAGRPEGLRLLLSVLFVGAPVLFAAVCFALRFKSRADVATAFGWNLLGAVAGGLLEFTSMAMGIKALSLVALLAYLGAFWVRERELRSPELAPPGSG